MGRIKQWPFGLLEDVFTCGSLKEPYPHDLDASVEYAVNLLDEKVATMLFERYKQGMTLDAISKLHSISRERARQIIEKGLRKLRHPSVMRYIQYGVSGVLRMEKTEAAEVARKRATEEHVKKLLGNCTEDTGDMDELIEKLNVLDTPIQKLNFSTRSCNGLLRGGCKTLGDVLNLTNQQFTSLRCVGVKSRDEIVKVLEEMGQDCKHLQSSEE